MGKGKAKGMGGGWSLGLLSLSLLHSHRPYSRLPSWMESAVSDSQSPGDDDDDDDDGDDDDDEVLFWSRVAKQIATRVVWF